MSSVPGPTGKEVIYGDNAIPVGFLCAAEIAAGVGVVVTILAIWLYLRDRSNPERKVFLQAVWVVWALAPPLWFWYEYFFLFKNRGPADAFEAFKYGQDVASKVWLAVVAVLSGILAKK